MRRFTSLSILFSVLLLAGISLADEPGAALMQADRDFCRAVAERRLEGWMEYMADNAVVGLASPTPAIGKEAVRKAMQAPFANPDFTLTWEPTRGEIFRGGMVGYTVGRWTRTVKKGTETQTAHGTYITVWQKQPDGTWKVAGDGGTDDSK